MYYSFQTQHSEGDRDKSPLESHRESGDEAAASDQLESVGDDKSAAEKSDNNENNSDADSVDEPIDDSDADKDWEPKEVSEADGDEQDELEISSEDESGKELTQIEKKSGHVPDSDGDDEKQQEYDEGSISDVVPDTPPRPKLTPVKTSQTKSNKSSSNTKPKRIVVEEPKKTTISPTSQGGIKISSPSSTEKTSENVSKKNSSTKSTANVTKSTVSTTRDTSEKTMPGSTTSKSAVSANTPKRPSKTTIKPMKVKLSKTITPLSQSNNAKKKVSPKKTQISKPPKPVTKPSPKTDEKKSVGVKIVPENTGDVQLHDDGDVEMVEVFISSQDPGQDPGKVAVADVVYNDDINSINEHEQAKTNRKKTEPVYAVDSDSDIPPGKEKFGDTTKPKRKSSDKLPAKNSWKRRSISPSGPSPPPKVIPKKTSGIKQSVETKIKPHKTSAQAAKTFSQLRHAVATDEPPTKKKKVSKYAEDYHDAGGAGSSTSETPQPTKNPLSYAPKSYPTRGKGKVTSKKPETPKTAKTVEEEKVQALKDLATKYGTNPNPIIINNPPIMSPTPSVISARSTRSEDDEDDLTIWGRLIVRKLRKYTDKRLQEDVQNYIHVLVTDAERGEWRKPASLTVNPNSPHLADNKTPERLPHITHIIRSPRVTSNRIENVRNVQTHNHQESMGGSNTGGVLPQERIVRPNIPVQQEQFVAPPPPTMPQPHMPNNCNVAQNVPGTVQAETENTDFSYTWQASHPNLTTGQHNPHIYLNYNQFGGGAGGVGSDRQVDNSAQKPTCSQRTYTQLQ